MDQEMKDLLYLIYGELKEVKTRVTNLENSVAELRMDIKQLRSDVDALRSDVDALRSDMDALRGDADTLRKDMDQQIATTNSLQEQITALRKQEQHHFDILDQDLGGALDGMTFLDQTKVDKKALKQAAI